MLRSPAGARVERGCRHPLPPSEPDVRVSPHPAQAVTDNIATSYVARKVRRLRSRTIRSALRRRVVPRVRLPRLGDAPNLPRGWRPLRRASGDLPDPRQRPFGPGQAALSAGLWLPLAFRLAALASWVFVCPLRDGAVLPKIVGLTGRRARPQRGCHVPLGVRRGRVGCPLYCGA